LQSASESRLQDDAEEVDLVGLEVGHSVFAFVPKDSIRELERTFVDHGVTVQVIDRLLALFVTLRAPIVMLDLVRLAVLLDGPIDQGLNRFLCL